MSTRKKIVLYGAGNIAGSIAQKLMESPYDIGLFDVVKDFPQGKALDLNQAAMMRGAKARFFGTNNPKDIADADIVIVTAGGKRTPTMSRDDLLFANAKVISEVAEHIKEHCPRAFVIVVTNPLDAMVGLLQKVSGLPTNMVVGMAGILDTTRMKYFIRELLEKKGHNCSSVHATICGGHGDLMVAVRGSVVWNGARLETLIEQELLTEADWDQIVQKTRDGGTQVGALMGTSAYVAPAMAVVQMTELYLGCSLESPVVPCATFLEKPFCEVSGFYVGVPCLINSQGANSCLSDIMLTEAEQAAFRESAAAVAGLNQQLADAGYFSKAA